MDNNSLAHTKWKYKYYVISAPKYRKRIIYGNIKVDVGEISGNLYRRKGIGILEVQRMPDHVHILVRIPSKYPISEIMGYLKRKPSLVISEKHANLKYEYGSHYFWCRGYYVDTVGKNTTTIRNYIQDQIREDLEYDQMTMSGCIDSFTGEPVKKDKR